MQNNARQFYAFLNLYFITSVTWVTLVAWVVRLDLTTWFCWIDEQTLLSYADTCLPKISLQRRVLQEASTWLSFSDASLVLWLWNLALVNFIWVPFDLSAIFCQDKSQSDLSLVQATELSETPRQILVLDGGWRESGARTWRRRSTATNENTFGKDSNI